LAGEFGGQGDAVGDDAKMGDVGQPGADGPRHFQGGGAGVQIDGLPALEQPGGGAADGLFLRLVVLQADGVIDVAVEEHGAAMHAAQQAACFEFLQVPPHRHFRKLELFGQLARAALASGGEDRHDQF